MRSLGSLGTVNPNNKKAHEELRQRHPAHAVPGHTDEIPSPLSASLDAVLAALQSFPRGSSPGASQLNSQHLLDAIGTTTPSAKHCLENLTCLINFLLSGRADPRIAPWLCGAPLTALLKKQGGIRPIAVGEVLHRLISRLCCSAVKADLPDTFLPYGQVGVGVPGGLDAAIHALSSCIARYGSDPSLCCLKIDMTNAFNECSRVSFLGRLHKEFPALFGWSSWCYHCESMLSFGSSWIKSCAGVQQGDPLGPLLFSLVVLEFLDELGPLPDFKLKVWYLDDGLFVGSRSSVAGLLDLLISKGPSFGLHANLKKCEIFWPSGDQEFPAFAPEIQRSVNIYGGIDFLGCPVYGPDSYVCEFVSQRVDRILNWQDRLSALEDPQVELHLLRSCLSLCKLNHIIRTVPGCRIDEVLLRFDRGLHHSLESLSSSSISDLPWRQATLPTRLGGLGLREAHRSSSAAFVGSCNSSRTLSLRLLFTPSMPFSPPDGSDSMSPTSVFPGELECRQCLADLLPPNSTALSVNSTQHSIQRALDDALKSSVRSSLCSLREQARFNAVTFPHVGAWLRAIPNPNLSLAMSPREFVTALRLRLGVPVFSPPPRSIRCVCGHILDVFGDHALGCSSSLRIRRHDALCDTVYHWLLVDNSGVRREQRCSSQSMDRPGDVFHPDFSNGKAAYFDISVRNSFSPSHVINAAVKAGAAAQAGEMEKDERHDSNVSSYGCLFYPLVVESYGVWSEHSLELLKSIAKKSTLSTGHSFSRAITNLHEQLSVKLWQYNSRMITEHLDVLSVASVCSGVFQ